MVREVLSNHQEVCHYWSNQVQESGRASRVFFEGPIIYSYGRHFPMARIINKRRNGKKVILFTTASYSSSTSKHLTYVWRAIDRDKYHIVCCSNVEADSKYRHGQNIDVMINTLKSTCEKQLTARTNVYSLTDNLDRIINYGAMFNVPWKRKFSKIRELFKQAKKKAALCVVAEEKAAEKRQIRQKKETEIRKKKAAEQLIHWLKGDIDNFYSHDLDTHLRIKGDNVQTTQGAKIPIEAAKKLYELRAACMKLSKEFTEPIQLGVYRLSNIDAEGNIKAGCHYMKTEIIEQFIKDNREVFA